MENRGGEPRSKATSCAIDERTRPSAPEPEGRVRRIGRLRVPLTLTCRPWATLFVMPDGRALWCVRLWDGAGPAKRLLPTTTLRAYARASGLSELEREIAELLDRGGVPRDREGA
jgi:hypothetical protein